jgi:hypothetical protein
MMIPLNRWDPYPSRDAVNDLASDGAADDDDATTLLIDDKDNMAVQ